MINGVTNRNSPNASAEFESEYKKRSTLRARESRVALVGKCESIASFEPNALETEFETEICEDENENKKGVSALESGLNNVNYFIFGEGNGLNDNKQNSVTDAEDKKDSDSGLGEGLVMEIADCTSKF